ncbi:MAG: transferrin-binding protein-like solute binding protein [Immundisolibacterales bacterium]|nr:transferrin-binding protein-like solute binding protein [Immundisolibacterales bacterium]
MNNNLSRYLCIAILISAIPAVTSCGGGTSSLVREPVPDRSLELVRSRLTTLQSAFEILEIEETTPDAISELKDALVALKAKVDSLLARTDISREELDELRAPIEELDNSLSRVVLQVRIPHGLHQGSETTTYAGPEDVPLQTLLQEPTNEFAPLSATLARRLSDPNSSAHTGDFRVKSISSDGANGFRVVYEVDDVERTVSFLETDFDTPGCRNCYTKDDDGVGYWLLENRGGTMDFRYMFPGRFSLMQDDLNLRAYMSFGSRTKTVDLPTGEVTYVGYLDSDTYATDDPGQRERIRGIVNLTTDFGAGTMEGRIRHLEKRSSGENSYLELPETTHFAARDATLADGRLLGALAGVDLDANALSLESVRGYQGAVLGEFYGPKGEEFGGVVSATSEEHNRVLGGTLRSRRLNPRVPSASPTVVSTAIDRDYSASTTTLSDSSRVVSIQNDGASGLHVTFTFDGGSHRIHFEGRDYGANSGFPTMYFESDRNREFYLWDYTGGAFVDSPEFDYLNVSGWTVAEFESAGDDTPGFVARGPSVYGVATDALPAGTATYNGRIYASSEPMNHANHALRSTIRGSLSLTADFDAGTVRGTIDEIETRASGGSSFEATDGLITVESGAIAGSQLQADLTGQRGQAGFEGEMTGGFYGPDAMEIGGILKGTNTSDSSVVYGWFGGKKP